MHTDTVLVVTVLVLCFAVVSGVVKRLYIAPALVFAVLGLLLGPHVFGVVKVQADREDFRILAELALTVILFNQAATLDVRYLFRRDREPLRLLGIGIPISIALGTLSAVVVLPVLPFWEAVCLAAIVAPTEVALIDALLEDHRVPERVRAALSVESGLFDGLALAVLLAALALASEHADPSGWRWAWFAFLAEIVSMAIGIGIGSVGGRIVALARARGWMSGTWAQLAALGLAVVCFSVGEHVHGSGFVAAFTGGLAYATTMSKSGGKGDLTEVSDAAAQILELVVFALFGAMVVVPAWREVDWRTVVFAVLALVVVRLAAVTAASFGSGIPRRQTLFIAWFGPRGIGTIVLALIVLEEGDVLQGTVIVQAAVVVVTLSLVLHSLTALPGIRWVGADNDAARTETKSTTERP